jgi:hypothetical protein
METTAPTIDLNQLDNKQTAAGFAAIYNKLPPILLDCCKVLTDPTEKAVFLLSGLGVLSGILPNVWGVYDGNKVYPNLFVFVLGRYGSGKGALRYARQLAEQIHKARTAVTESEKADALPEQTTPQLLHFVPANNSKTGFFELLFTNQGSGTLFESEGDTLTDAINQDYGRFSDGLRKAFHHEPITYYRRAGREFCEIAEPRLSVVLSGTPDQLQKLIPTPENGLFSRFCYFQLPENADFKDVFNPEKSDYPQAFRWLGSTCYDIHNFLMQAPEPYQFTFTKPQQTRFVEYFRNLKSEIRENITLDLDGVIHRLGLQYFRIAMIFTVLRHFGAKGLRRPLVCSDLDFELTAKIIENLKDAAIEVYLSMPQPEAHPHSITEKAKHYEKALELKAAGQSYGQIAESIFGTQTKKSTIYRWLNL